MDLTEIKTLPSNQEAEIYVLSCILFDNHLIKDCLLVRKDFFNQSNGMIFYSMQQLGVEDKVIDPITVGNILKSKGKLEEIGGIDYLFELSVKTSSTSGFKDYVEIIKKMSVQREFIIKTKKLLNKGYDDFDLVSVKQELQDLKDQIEGKRSKFRHITYEEKIDKAGRELLDTEPDDIIKRGRDERDNLLGGIYGGKIYVVGADTGSGKSTFVNQVCRNVSSTGLKVVKYSLEDRLEDIGKEEIFYEVNRLRARDKKQFYERVKFVNAEYSSTDPGDYYGYIESAIEILKKSKIVELEKDKQVTVDDLIELMEEECKNGARLFAIDHLHYFEFDSAQSKVRLDLQIQNAMHKINEIARRYNVPVILVAHYKSNKVGKITPSYDDFKDGSAIKQVANIIIQILRDFDTNISEFYITKMRGPIKPKVLETQFDLFTYEYTFRKSDKQREKEKKTGDF